MKLDLFLVLLLVLGACSSGSSSPSGSSDSGAASGDSNAAGGDAADGPPSVGDDASASDTASDTWDNWGQAFFSKYCVECHSASDSTGRDFTMKSIVVSNAPTIRCGVCNAQDPSWGCAASPHAQQFPIDDTNHTNPKPASAERDRVVAWIAAGCL